MIKSTWDNDERSIVKSSFYEEMEKTTFSFDAPKITNIYVDHENYTMTIEYDATTGTPYGIKRSPKDTGSRIETIGKNKKGPGLPTSSKSLYGKCCLTPVCDDNDITTAMNEASTKAECSKVTVDKSGALINNGKGHAAWDIGHGT